MATATASETTATSNERGLEALLAQVAEGQTVLVATGGGELRAAILPWSEYQRLLAAADEREDELALESALRVEAECAGQPTVSLEAVEAAIAAERAEKGGDPTGAAPATGAPTT